MPSREEYLRRPVIERVMRLVRTGSELAAAIGGRDPEASAAVFERRRHALPVRPCLFGAQWRQEAHRRAAVDRVLEQRHQGWAMAKHLRRVEAVDGGRCYGRNS